MIVRAVWIGKEMVTFALKVMIVEIMMEKWILT